MSATERLYYHDSRLLEFDARVIDLSEREDGAIAVMLDRTAFYPTGGGQPNDTGTLGEARVVDCIDMKDEGVLHVIQGPTPEVGEMVHGRIDSLRRLDHMQQHTGQHILSAAFVKLFEAPTRSFRMLEHEFEIDDFDLTPCGGTHAQSTGEVGIIAVRNWERAKGLTRIQFMAGVRVLNDYRKANRTAAEVAASFSAGRDDSPPLVARLIEENKRLARRVRELDEIACRVEAEELLRNVARNS